MLSLLCTYERPTDLFCYIFSRAYGALCFGYNFMAGVVVMVRVRVRIVPNIPAHNLDPQNYVVENHQ